MLLGTPATVSGFGGRNKCVPAGQNIEAANPRFVGGAIPNLAQLARASVVTLVDT